LTAAAVLLVAAAASQGVLPLLPAIDEQRGASDLTCTPACNPSCVVASPSRRTTSKVPFSTADTLHTHRARPWLRQSSASSRRRRRRRRSPPNALRARKRTTPREYAFPRYRRASWRSRTARTVGYRRSTECCARATTPTNVWAWPRGARPPALRRRRSRPLRRTRARHSPLRRRPRPRLTEPL